MKTLWFLTLSILLAFGCGQMSKPDNAASSIDEQPPADMVSSYGFAANQEESAAPEVYNNDEDKAAETNDVPVSATPAPIKTPDKIIKTGNLSMEVEEYQKAMQMITDKVKAAQGYISNQNEQRGSYRISNSVSIRVPSQNFDALVNGIGDVAKTIISKTVSMHDVSEEYTDVAARLKTKREVELRYLDILKSAKTIKDILEVENQLQIIREEIESATARLRYMDDRVSYSTISVEVFQDIAYNAPAPLQAGFGSKLLASLIAGWNGLLALTIGMVRIWPLLLVIGVVLFFLYRKWKRGTATA